MKDKSLEEAIRIYANTMYEHFPEFAIGLKRTVAHYDSTNPSNYRDMCASYESMIKEITDFCGKISLASNPSDYCSGEARGENSVKNTIHVIVNKYKKAK